MSQGWFRMYAKFATDLVVQSLSFEDQRHWVMVLCMKCDGILDRDISKANRDRLIEKGLGVTAEAAKEIKNRLISSGFCDKNWQPLNWNKLQFKSDDSTPRARKSRKNKETRNGQETFQQQPNERCKTAPHVRATETETDLPTEGAPPPDFRQAVWTLGVALLGEHNRQLLGKLAKDHGEETLASAIGETASKRPADPKTYLLGILKPKQRRAVL